MMEIVHGPCLKVLVAYYSCTGNTQTVAQEIREKTCGVLFSVETHKPYLPQTVEEDARHERESGKLPMLKYAVPCMTCYDLMLIGGPVWHRTLSTPLMAFLRDADFAGRRVASFCTHEGDAGTYFKDFQSRVRNARVTAGLELDISRHNYGPVISSRLDAWLHKLGISKPEVAAV